MSSELQEMHEHAEHAKHDPSLVPITLTLAVLAVLVALVSLLGHRATTEQVLLQNKITDQWAFFQAKNIRRHTDELFADLTGVVSGKDAEAVTKLKEKYEAEAERYKDEQKDLEAEARKLEHEVDVERRRADKFDLAEGLLEIALVISSVALLSGKKIFWKAGLVLAAVGVLVAVLGLMIA
jgi:hypothetical protein